MIWSALALAHECVIPAGVGYDPTDPHPVVVFIDLPGAGQVSWHLPAYPTPWDGHATDEKYRRVAAFTTASAAPTLAYRAAAQAGERDRGTPDGSGDAGGC